MFLTAEELADLTGYKLPSKQVEWLRRHGWRFATNAVGHPRVARSFFEVQLGGGARAPSPVAVPPAGMRPNFDALARWQGDGAKTAKQP